MIHKVGLLPQCNFEQLPFAYDMYKRDDEDSHKLSGMFKETFCIDVNIKFVGVWYVVRLSIDPYFMSPHRDTVNSIGLIEDSLPFADQNTTISYFRHAMSLDERRVKFRPLFYTGETSKGNGGSMKTRGHVAESSDATAVEEEPQSSCNGKMGTDSTDGQETETDFEEVFFAGVHCGVFQLIRVPRPAIHSHPFRCRRRIREKRKTQQSRTHSASVDDQRMLQSSHRYHF